MALTFFWTCESETFNADDYSAGDSTPTKIGGASISIASGGAKIGSNGIVNAASVLTTYYFDVASIIPSPTDPSLMVFSVGYWVRQVTVDSAFRSFGFYLTDTDANNYIMVKTATGGQLQLDIHNSAGSITLTTSGTGMSNNTWYFVVVRVDFPNNKRSIEIYGAGDLVTPQSSNSSTASLATNRPTALNQYFRVGFHNASITSETHFDNAFASDSYDEALQSYANITSITELSNTIITPNVAAVSI